MARADGSVGKVHGPTETFVCSLGGEATNASVANGLYSFRMPYKFEVAKVKASCVTAPLTTGITINIKEAGTTILSTLLTIDPSEVSSATAAVPAVISDSTIAEDALVSCDITVIGTGTVGAGVKVYLIGNRVL